MAIDRYNLNLAGEHRVCAELLKRGLFATLTYGNKKGADIYAIGANRRAAVIEVKSSNSARFVTCLYQKYPDPTLPHPDFWALYSIIARDESFEERFFILAHEELAVAQGTRNMPNSAFTYAEMAARVVNGVDNVLIRHVESHENRWNKVIDFCNHET